LPEGGSTATDVTFVGKVTDDTGSPLQNAQVSIEGRAHGTLSGPDGRWSFTVPSLLDGSSVTVVARAIGYSTARDTRRVRGDTVRIDFVLKQAHAAIEALVVGGAPQALGQFSRGFAAEKDCCGRRADPDWNTESYDLISENEFRSVTGAPLSTFSVDVD